jgi:hypothetical protein
VRPTSFLIIISLLVLGAVGGLVEGAEAPKAGAEAAKHEREFLGTATKTGSGLSILFSEGIRYRLKAADGAPAEVAKVIEAIKNGEAEGKAYRVIGSLSEDERAKEWIAVRTIAEVPGGRVGEVKPEAKKPPEHTQRPPEAGGL